jgi:hypothetical protein
MSVFDKRRRTRHTLRVEQKEGDGWAAELVRRVGEAAKTARGSKSAAWLSARTERLGYKLSVSVIAKLDSGHRGSVLSVAELCVLAAALDVPPIALLFPDLPDGDVQFLPNQWSASDDAMRWFCGESGTVPFDLLSGALDHSDLAPNDKAQLVEAVRRRRDRITEALSASAKSDDFFQKYVPGLINEVRAQDARIRALGGVVNDARWLFPSSHTAEGDVDA